MSRRRLAVALALLVLAACERQAPPTAPSVPATVPASPGARAVTAVPALAFLPPLDNGVANPATFDATAAPVVEICAWNGSACAAPPVVVFSTSPTSPVLPLAINAAAGRYEATWDLLDTRFVSRKTYRIRVLQGTAELGAVSVDVVRGRWALTRTDGSLAPLVSATTLPIRFALNTTSTTNQRPTATITAPPLGSAYIQGESITFSGSATDPEDGTLTGASLVWTSDRDGQIGTGASFSVSTPSVGTHVVTLTATDNQGATGTASVTIVVAPIATPGNLPNGATVTGRIAAAHQVDQWTFAANGGEHAVISLGATGVTAGFVPLLRIVDPSGSVVGTNFGNSAAQVELSGLAPGIYTVRVSSGDGGGVGTGDYRLTSIRTPGALVVSSGDQGGTLTNGGTSAGNIYTGDIDGWTFTASAGDHAIISLGETANSSGFTPWLRVIGPTGTVVGSDFGFEAAQVDLGALAAGTYTVIVGSAAGGFTGTGDYLLTLVKAPGALTISNADQGGALTNGATHTGSIYSGDIDGWTFTANAGDHAVISLGETANSSGFSPWLRVIAPDGSVAGSNFGTTAAQVELNSLAAGTYTVIVGSAAGGFTGTGDYLLTLIDAPGTLTTSAGDEGGVLVNGATQTGSIYTGDVDGWTFTANAGDHAVISLGETSNSSGFSPWLRIVGPNGALVASDFGFEAAQVELNALTAGTYTVIVGSAAGGFTGTGDYLLTLVKAPGALSVSSGDEGGTLVNGATHTGSIYTGDIDGWTFTANAGDHAVVSLGETTNSSGFSPWLRVIGPTGAAVGSNFGTTAAQVELNNLAAGTYTVIVGSAAGGFTGTGDYLLTLIRAPGPLAASSGDQGGTLANGVARTGSIYTGDIDGWTFNANTGDPIVLNLVETTNESGFAPWLRVVGPTGTLVAANFGFTAAQVSFAAPTVGTYTVIVGSAAGGFTGTSDYSLVLTGATAAPAAQRIGIVATPQPPLGRAPK